MLESNKGKGASATCSKARPTVVYTSRLEDKALRHFSFPQGKRKFKKKKRRVSIELLMGYQFVFGTVGLAPTTLFCCPHASSHSLPMARLPMLHPTSHFITKQGKNNTGFLLMVNVQIPLQVKMTLVVNSPAYMNITKAPWIILSDILISATVSTRYLPPSCCSGVWRFSRVAILGVYVFLHV